MQVRVPHPHVDLVDLRSTASGSRGHAAFQFASSWAMLVAPMMTAPVPMYHRLFLARLLLVLLMARLFSSDERDHLPEHLALQLGLLRHVGKGRHPRARGARDALRLLRAGTQLCEPFGHVGRSFDGDVVHAGLQRELHEPRLGGGRRHEDHQPARELPLEVGRDVVPLEREVVPA